MAKEKKYLYTVIFIICAFLLPIFGVFADDQKCVMPTKSDIKMQVDWPASPLSNPPYSISTDPDPTIPKLVKYFFEWGIGLGGIAVFIALIIAGVQYITSIANPTQTSDARRRIKSSLIGLILLLGSWAIFNLINPNLNYMQDLPNISSQIVGTSLITDRECASGLAYECCRLPKSQCDPANPADCPAGTVDCCMDPNCIPNNWYCCQKNDFSCIKGNSAARAQNTRPGALADNSATECFVDANCVNWNCECNRGYDPISRTPIVDPVTKKMLDWKKFCRLNQYLCIAVTGKSELGCDLVQIYSGPLPTSFPAIETFGGITNAPSTSRWASNYPGGSVYNYSPLDTDSGWKDPGFSIGSYAAYRYGRTKDGKIMTDANGNPTTVIPCGSTACGCKIDFCENNGPALSFCSGQSSNSGYDFAFNSSAPGNYKSFNIKDDTKGVWGAAARTKDNIVNTIFRWLGLGG